MLVSAGDLEKYAYCPLSWWLSKTHKVVAKDGVAHHRNTERDLKDIQRKEKSLKFYERYILFFAVSASLIAVVGIALLYGEGSEFWKYFFVVIALLWLLNSSFFLYRASRTESIVKARYERLLLLSAMGAIIIAFFSILFATPANPAISRFAEILSLLWVILANIIFYRTLIMSDELIARKIKYAPVKGEIEYVGAAGEGEEIISEKYGIRGTPDYIIKLDDEYIPVEEKSASRDSPAFPHVMQITAYCMLVEDHYGRTPSYGILKYRDAEFKIPYERRWKTLVLALRKQLLENMERGEAHRNHHNAKKCEHCARRTYCPERLA